MSLRTAGATAARRATSKPFWASDFARDSLAISCPYLWAELLGSYTGEHEIKRTCGIQDRRYSSEAEQLLRNGGVSSPHEQANPENERCMVSTRAEIVAQ